MSLQVDIHGVAGKDQIRYCTATYNGAPLNLSSYTITAYLKASRTTSDGSATTFTTSSGITVTNALMGQFSLAIPRADLTTAGSMWYRIDIEDGASRIYTVLFGNVNLISA